MRAHHRKWLMFGGFLLVIVFSEALFLASGPKEPAHDGKGLSRWLGELDALDYVEQWDPHTKQAQAVRAIGTNAIPWLLRDLQAHIGLLELRLNQLLAKQPVIKLRFNVEARRRRGLRGFQALGELGEPAIPALLGLVESDPGCVPDALAAIGPAAVPALQQCLTNTRSYATSVGQIALIPGHTIGAIHNAMFRGRLSKSDVMTLLPAIRDWAQSTNRPGAQYNYAADFLSDVDH